MRNTVLMVGALLLLAGCVTENESAPNADVLPNVDTSKLDPVIVGSVNWVETSALATNDARRLAARPVALLQFPAAGVRCTGFLLSTNILITNHHCVSSQAMADGATATFDAEAGVPDSAREVVDCSEFLGASEALDMGLLRCAGRPGDVHGKVTLSANPMSVGSSIYVVHQNCDYYANPACVPNKKLSPGAVTSVDAEIAYDADTLGGSSGAALFDDQNRVVGLHHVGVGGDATGRGSYNQAIKMGQIIPVLQANFPEIFSQPAARPPVTEPVNDPTLDRFEPNNDTSTASAINLPFDGQDLFIKAGDRDMFKVVLSARKTLRVSMFFSNAAGDLDLYVYKLGQRSPVARSVGTSDREDVSVTLAAGTYYVMASGYADAAGAYRITVQ